MPCGLLQVLRLMMDLKRLALTREGLLKVQERRDEQHALEAGGAGEGKAEKIKLRSR